MIFKPVVFGNVFLTLRLQLILEPPSEEVDAPLTEFQFTNRINHVTPYANRVLCIALICYQKIIGGLTISTY